MKDELQQTKDLITEISDAVHYFVVDNISDEWMVLVSVKVLLLTAFIFFIDFFLKFLVRIFLATFKDEEKHPVFKALYTSKVINSMAHLVAMMIGRFALYSVFSRRHPESFAVLDRLMEVAVVLIVGGMALRAIKAVENYYFYKKDYYRIVALRAISQTLRIFGTFILSVIIISMVFGISGATILGSLGAITAVLVLVFRDTILGFVTGIHVATSQNMKVGDWIGIPKYNLEGNILDINLLTTKIQNFDKTISTIPTYDLLATEIKNLQVMAESNTRRIKRSIIFNINSFTFLNRETIEKLEKINLITDYLEQKKTEMIAERESIANPELLINGRQLTNIGVFREYVFNYLKRSQHIDQEGTVLVRQLENTPEGMPLEIYCFTNNSEWSEYEQIMADIFDHLLVASKEFNLEVVQFSKIAD
ncbi:MAG: mechanosensitive ion channel family protein [Kaistella sp.]|nr:mechanosensitive ion channel family protein [Kaistella sp.]